ncbi:MAG: hypothetical protein ABSA74_04120 [Candidatus Staskawiczbacteria bacterium]
MKTTIGIERERFIIRREDNMIVPAIGTLLPVVWEKANMVGLPASLFDYELFAGQIEDKTPPCYSLLMLKEALLANDFVMKMAADQVGLDFDSSEFVGGGRITALEPNPFDQNHRHEWFSMPPEMRLAISVLADVHVHLSATKKQAVALLNLCRKDVVSHLIKIGDHSDGKRIGAYLAIIQSDGIPPTFSSFVNLVEYIKNRGGEKNVWDLVRYKPSTETIEFRMFGAAKKVEDVVGYAVECLKLLRLI